ncbi:MAG: bifunctional phosphoribosylaminoimidazolecarboxamide formyltransferase/IMP cyclohydrolase [Methanomicrobiales archaeon]|jgi:phosphoribosylaminoimidazolecarboxamide formyltransferase/IMP cyclohydrolase|nr:bifunctional phosphoribosylaminoimidazolecarboxamide formyltransferase/IMP cyclohydrolase [Methanomicrobiales archaeon]
MKQKRALLSVWKKDGIVELAKKLENAGYELISSGGTAQALRQSGICVTEVSDYTGFPEMMDGRVKTLHPRIHGGLLGRLGIDDAVMEKHDIPSIDLLVVNLYPFEEMSKQALPLDELIEFIDIGGPAMIRAAAKNYKDTIVVIDPGDYSLIAESLSTQHELSLKDRLKLAAKVFSAMAKYDGEISNYLGAYLTREDDSSFSMPPVYSVQFECGRSLRYGENPHQQAMVYGTSGIAGCAVLQGKEMSYNNYLDLDSCYHLLLEFTEPAAVIVKHNNPCGVATGKDVLKSYLCARDIDPESAYGSVVCVNREVDERLAEEIASTFVEIIAAPSFSAQALEICTQKENMRVIVLGEPIVSPEIRSIDGGALVQRTPPIVENWKVVTERDPSAAEEAAMALAMKVCAHTKSNTIIFADATRAIGIGAGQMSRVDAARIAIQKARFPLTGTAVASDAFLPFPDTLEICNQAGATALVQPGGSIRDAEVIQAANKVGMAMVFTGVRHFKH